MARLTPEQEAALSDVTAAHRARLTARTDARAEADRIIAERTRDAELAESRAVRRAVAAGVPKSRIGKDGLDTSDFATVGKVMALTDGEARAEEAVQQAVAQKQAEHFRPASHQEYAELEMVPAHARIMRVDWPDYAPPAGGDFRSIHGVSSAELRGFVYLDTDSKDWLVLRDDLRGSFATNPAGPLQDALDWDETLRDAVSRAAR